MKKKSSACVTLLIITVLNQHISKSSKMCCKRKGPSSFGLFYHPHKIVHPPFTLHLTFFLHVYHAVQVISRPPFPFRRSCIMADCRTGPIPGPKMSYPKSNPMQMMVSKCKRPPNACCALVVKCDVREILYNVLGRLQGEDSDESSSEDASKGNTG